MSTISRRIHPPETKGHVSAAMVPDAWYVACRSGDLGETPEARTILATPVVLFRDAAGRAGALLDRCPHRNIRLSLGRVDEEGHLACGYHGWRFDREGLCRGVPGLLETSESDARRRAAPRLATREQDGFVWVWGRLDAEPTGEPQRIPHVDDPEYVVLHREYLFECTLHAALENALDVPHTAFVHRGDFRGKGRNPVEAVRRRIPDGIEVEYRGEPPLAGPATDEAGNAIVQRHWDRFFMPSVAQVEYRTGGDRHTLVTFPHTPVSDFETRGFMVACWKLPGDRDELRTGLDGYLDTIMAQDVTILREQTEGIRRFGGEAYESTDLDLMGPEIWRMLRQAERGLDPNSAEIGRTVKLTV
jgi:phenylpropionate dioxygenase-like ring-hydroxylating dioxygenase large terminal subunit